MKPLILSFLVLVILSCNDHKKESPATENDTTAIAPSPVTDTTHTAPSGKIDIERFGPVKIGQPASETLKALGEPDEKTVATEWGADGLMHEDWIWIKHGLKINMSLSSHHAKITLNKIMAQINAAFYWKPGQKTAQAARIDL